MKVAIIFIFVAAVVTLCAARVLNPAYTSALRALQRERNMILRQKYYNSLHHEANQKRCINTLDDSCANGGLPDNNSDDDWINGGGTPGKRCINSMDNSCANGGLPDSNSDDDWINGGNNPGKK